MICISINQESRRLAMADMVNAKREADLLEFRLDRFGKAPEIGEMLANKPKPVIMSCKRQADGGFWDGTEEERQAILRQCIISKVDYAEIEVDVAGQIRPFPPAQRVISYTNLQETPEDIAEIYDHCRSANPDVIKLMTLARTPEEAWPLVQILARSSVPTVVVGLGKPGIMLTILGKKLGAPWAYAALERGLEAYPGQPTVEDLKRVYHYESVNKNTRFIGVTGFGDREVIVTAVLNAVFAHHELPFRCLPMGVGSMKVFRKVMEATKIAGAVIDAEHQAEILEIEPQLHGGAKQTGAVDLVIHKGDAWHGMHLGAQAWVQALGVKLKEKFQSESMYKDRLVMIVGVNRPAQILAGEVQRQGGSAILASHQRKLGLEIAQKIGCRFVAFEALYSTMHDCLVVCDDEKDHKDARQGVASGVHVGYLKPGMVVMDLSANTRDSELIREAGMRGATTVKPKDLLLQLLQLQAKALVGKETPIAILENAIPERFRPEEE